MKKILLLRHAKASRDIPFIRDIERPLTEKGFHDARLVSEHLKKKVQAPGIILSSPAIRAYSTALIFASAFHCKEDSIQLDNRLYNSSVKEYLEVIREIDNSYGSALVTGHNEVLSETAQKLLHDNSFESLPTCGVVVLFSAAKSWKEMISGPCSCEGVLFPSLFKEM